MALAFGAGNLARGCVNTQLLVLPGIGSVAIRTIRPIGKNEVSAGLEIQFPFPCGAENTIPVCLIEDSDCTAPAANTLVACDFGDIKSGGVETSSVVTW